VRNQKTGDIEAPVREGQPNAWEKYRNLLVTGIERWKKVKEQLADEGDSRTISTDFRGRPGPRFLLPSYFAATNSRYQRRMVSGVAIVATCSNAFRPSALPSFASRRRCPTVSRSRCFPSRSKSAAFSALCYSITRAWCSPNHIPIHASKNCNGSGSDFSAEVVAARAIPPFYASRSHL
jgi:hypothetical protein